MASVLVPHPPQPRTHKPLAEPPTPGLSESEAGSPGTCSGSARKIVRRPQAPDTVQHEGRLHTEGRMHATPVQRLWGVSQEKNGSAQRTPGAKGSVSPSPRRVHVTRGFGRSRVSLAPGHGPWNEEETPGASRLEEIEETPARAETPTPKKSAFKTSEHKAVTLFEQEDEDEYEHRELTGGDGLDSPVGTEEGGGFEAALVGQEQTRRDSNKENDMQAMDAVSLSLEESKIFEANMPSEDAFVGNISAGVGDEDEVELSPAPLERERAGTPTPERMSTVARANATCDSVPGKEVGNEDTVVKALFENFAEEEAANAATAAAAAVSAADQEVAAVTTPGRRVPHESSTPSSQVQRPRPPSRSSKSSTGSRSHRNATAASATPGKSGKRTPLSIVSFDGNNLVAAREAAQSPGPGSDPKASWRASQQKRSSSRSGMAATDRAPSRNDSALQGGVASYSGERQPSARARATVLAMVEQFAAEADAEVAAIMHHAGDVDAEVVAVMERAATAAAIAEEEADAEVAAIVSGTPIQRDDTPSARNMLCPPRPISGVASSLRMREPGEEGAPLSPVAGVRVSPAMRVSTSNPSPMLERPPSSASQHNGPPHSTTPVGGRSVAYTKAVPVVPTSPQPRGPRTSLLAPSVAHLVD